MSICAVDLFCGAGGLTCGLQKANIDVRAGFDIEQECRYPYLENNEDVEFVEANIAGDVSAEDLKSYLSSPDSDYTLIAGCAPCQPFSAMSNGNDGRTNDHEKWGLISEFSDLVYEVEPDLVTMENVPQARKHEPYDEFKNTLNDLGYEVYVDVVKCPNYGVPQSRKRLVVLASKHGHIELKGPTHDPGEVTVRSAFEEHDLVELEAGETADNDLLHNARGLSNKNIERIQKSVPGGTWEDWPEELRLACHQKDSGKRYTASYGRMEWDEPAPTMTTQFYNYGSGRFGHPKEDRAISVREGLILQTFPGDYSFVESEEDLNVVALGKMIGNAVPVRLGEVIGETLIRHVKGEGPQKKLPA